MRDIMDKMVKDKEDIMEILKVIMSLKAITDQASREDMSLKVNIKKATKVQMENIPNMTDAAKSLTSQ